MSVIAITNQKGGTGKTTTTLNLGAALATYHDKKVLLIDFDAQGSLTYSVGINQLHYDISNVLIGDCNISDIITTCENFDFVPAFEDLSKVEIYLSAMKKREYYLKNALEPVKKNYDVILIDCPPSISLLQSNALAVSDYALIPLPMETLNVKGLAAMEKKVEEVKSNFNSSLKILGVLPVMFHRKKGIFKRKPSINDEIMDFVNRNFDLYIFHNSIEKDPNIIEAPSHGKSLINFDPQGKAALKYKHLGGEILNMID